LKGIEATLEYKKKSGDLSWSLADRNQLGKACGVIKDQKLLMLTAAEGGVPWVMLGVSGSIKGHQAHGPAGNGSSVQVSFMENLSDGTRKVPWRNRRYSTFVGMRPRLLRAIQAFAKRYHVSLLCRRCVLAHTIYVDVDYMELLVERYWGKTGLAIMAIFPKVLRNVLPRGLGDDRAWYWRIDQGFTIVLTATREELTVIIKDENNQAEAISECLVWIDSVLGCPDEDGFYTKERKKVDDVCTLDKIRDARGTTFSQIFDVVANGRLPNSELITTRSYSRTDEAKIPSTELFNLCWAQLFKAAYLGESRIVSNPTVPSGKGLHMSFEFMIELSGVETGMVIDGGIILIGFRTALIPVELIDTGISQWHLIVDTDDGTRFRYLHDRPDFTSLLPEKRMLVRDVNPLKGDVFLGWDEEIQVLLGSDNLGLFPLRSSLPRMAGGWKLCEKGIQVGFQGGPSFFQFTGQHLRNYGSYSTRLRYPSFESFYLKIDELYRRMVFIYDDERATMWLCPMINLLIFMLQHYINRNEYNPTNPRAIQFPFGVDRAKSRIRRLDTVRIEEDLPQTYGDVLIELTRRYSTFFGRLEQGNDKLVGYDLHDILEPESYSWAKELKSTKSIKCWGSLLRNQDIVFCKGIGDVLAAAAPSESRCKIIPPEGRDLLIAPVELIQQLFNVHKRGEFEHTGERYRWVISGDPFKSCPGKGCDGDCWRSRLQEVVKLGLRDRTRSGNAITASPPLTKELPKRGGICFGSIDQKM
jgi:hypothetical protein